MKYFSMFSGVGGFEEGIKNATNNEWECVGYSEINKYAIQVYQHHFPTHKNFGDAVKIDTDKLPDFDLLCGGFPCQSFSLAGKRKGFQDTRGTLFYEILRIAKSKRPRLLLLENVKGLLSADDGRCFATIISSLDEVGYDVEWEVLNSKYFGVPQNRERVFIVGHLRGQCSRQVFPLGQAGETYSGAVTAPEGMDKITSTIKCGDYEKWNGNYIQSVQWDSSGKGYKSQQDRAYLADGISCALTGASKDSGNNSPIIIQSHSPRIGDGTKGGCGPLRSSEHCFTIDSTPHNDIMGSVKPILTPNRPEGRQNGRRMKEDGEDMFTLTGQDVHGVAMHNKIRRLTPTECARLQGFPDKWCSILSDSQAYKCYGNAVTTNVIQAIVEKMIKNGI